METDDSRRDAAGIVVANRQALAQKSSPLVRRGLVGLSAGDMTGVIEAGKEMTSSLSSGDELGLLIAQFTKLFPQFPLWSLLLMGEEEQELYVWVSGGKELHSLSKGVVPATWEVSGEEGDALRRMRIKPGQGIAGWVAQGLEPAIVPSVREDSRFLSNADTCLGIDVQSIVAVPMRFQESVGKGPVCLGVIELINCAGAGEFSDTDLLLLQTFADFAATAIYNRRYAWGLTKGVITDDHTDLYSAKFLKQVLYSELRRSQRHGRVFSVVVLEIANFEQVSRSRSWRNMNLLLLEIGMNIKSAVSLVDTPSWHADGEIIILLSETPKEKACQIARQLHKTISETTGFTEEILSAYREPLIVNAGVATYPDDGDNIQELSEQMYAALRLVKNSAHNGVAAAKLGVLPPL
jgi:diguanylate cyclase (GGDEF)-like protein